jgi:hypothetical protein
MSLGLFVETAGGFEFGICIRSNKRFVRNLYKNTRLEPDASQNLTEPSACLFQKKEVWIFGKGFSVTQ